MKITDYERGSRSTRHFFSPEPGQELRGPAAASKRYTADEIHRRKVLSEKACEITGSRHALAETLGVAKSTVDAWISGYGVVPNKRLPTLQQLIAEGCS
ncbi:MULTISPECIES: YdaS family helix-turn-helix protein [unclassified Halomonas]|uniref:YdaS family helix-turn-helix protein n=1 Tax=Halomonas TaxID=2745 RepID=UPI001C987C7C|nr:helix-turn-helix domain-containing protein [Halomonas sp. DP3Y7-2]MBY6229223.1 helix-turn-helix domain-containing protein [Halomonas sp. DP3Y7-1]MCA0917714.1 helix-turn-helix domain-containing protein [Halomonas denitrificans]